MIQHLFEQHLVLKNNITLYGYKSTTIQYIQVITHIVLYVLNSFNMLYVYSITSQPEVEFC